jgi:hypothetical protein
MEYTVKLFVAGCMLFVVSWIAQVINDRLTNNTRQTTLNPQTKTKNAGTTRINSLTLFRAPLKFANLKGGVRLHGNEESCKEGCQEDDEEDNQEEITWSIVRLPGAWQLTWPGEIGLMNFWRHLEAK